MFHTRFTKSIASFIPRFSRLALNDLSCPALSAFQVPEVTLNDKNLLYVFMYEILDLVLCLWLPGLEVCPPSR